MKKYLLLISFLFLLVSCGTFYDGLMTQCHYVVVNGTDKNGTQKMIHKDGWTFGEGKVVNSKKEGWWTYYRKDGTIDVKELFKDGEWNGEIIVFYENGQVAWKGVSDLVDPSSKVKTQYFAPDGTPISETEYSEKYYKFPGRWLDDLYEKQRMKLF